MQKFVLFLFPICDVWRTTEKKLKNTAYSVNKPINNHKSTAVQNDYSKYFAALINPRDTFVFPSPSFMSSFTSCYYLESLSKIFLKLTLSKSTFNCVTSGHCSWLWYFTLSNVLLCLAFFSTCLIVQNIVELVSKNIWMDFF